MSTNTIPSIPTIPHPPIPRGRAESPDSPERYARPDIREIPQDMRREWTKLRAKMRGTKILNKPRLRTAEDKHPNKTAKDFRREGTGYKKD